MVRRGKLCPSSLRVREVARRPARAENRVIDVQSHAHHQVADLVTFRFHFREDTAQLFAV